VVNYLRERISSCQ